MTARGFIGRLGDRRRNEAEIPDGGATHEALMRESAAELAREIDLRLLRAVDMGEGPDSLPTDVPRPAQKHGSVGGYVAAVVRRHARRGTRADAADVLGTVLRDELVRRGGEEAGRSVSALARNLFATLGDEHGRPHDPEYLAWWGGGGHAMPGNLTLGKVEAMLSGSSELGEYDAAAPDKLCREDLRTVGAFFGVGPSYWEPGEQPVWDLALDVAAARLYRADHLKWSPDRFFAEDAERALRESGVGVEDLADRAGAHRTYVAAVLAGLTPPEPDLERAVGDLLWLSLEARRERWRGRNAINDLLP